MERNNKTKKTIFFLLLFAFFLYGLYQFTTRKSIDKNGIYTKATITKAESTKGGILITVSYHYSNKKYEVILPSDLGNKSIGRQYFVQLLPEDPKTILFKRHEPVPDCLLNVEAPVEGWKQKPFCP